MAKVSSPEEIMGKKVPAPENFLYAADWLLANISHQTSSTEGALIFGSTTIGVANRRSDLDILVSFTPDDRRYSEVVRSYNDVFSNAESLFNVPVEPIIFSTAQLISGRHTIDPLFLSHLTTVSEDKWLVGTNPIHEIEVKNNDLLEVFLQYSVHKEKKFKKAIVDNQSAIDYRALQRAYELPSALGRKCLGLFVEMGIIEDEQYHTAPKQKIIQKISSYAIPAVVQPLTQLVDDNNKYSEMLDGAINREVSIDEYDEWLKISYSSTIDKALDLLLN